ncbi:hypothetical protein J3Q64DRAFT_1344559 [Phycomyces blakesleeanus]|uniref:Uncharacterized protein n=2 Tax=Phycomyces blakesleeanus TaxID=4837 RepID=A0A167R979_PHYB8|nr:hypothetical protein PHYBLDRAFT_138692 [Phycomyces blakesleeanus NRRL 1555(-)]OAD81148.1 hypothetical protein PHYBLDRAFT_138692 [Phycomyces blakesleeanus NRRL 1555(-)]|eukprot:XP_018299188.1 hypothetical protein PHYBLDRAFT_138692 [Phycomyces blakesleeanus NRRL 1555(-)]
MNTSGSSNVNGSRAQRRAQKLQENKRLKKAAKKAVQSNVQQKTKVTKYPADTWHSQLSLVPVDSRGQGIAGPLTLTILPLEAIASMNDLQGFPSHISEYEPDRRASVITTNSTTSSILTLDYSNAIAASVTTLSAETSDNKEHALYEHLYARRIQKLDEISVYELSRDADDTVTDAQLNSLTISDHFPESDTAPDKQEVLVVAQEASPKLSHKSEETIVPVEEDITQVNEKVSIHEVQREPSIKHKTSLKKKRSTREIKISHTRKVSKAPSLKREYKVASTKKERKRFNVVEKRQLKSKKEKDSKSKIEEDPKSKKKSKFLSLFKKEKSTETTDKIKKRKAWQFWKD